MPLSFFSPSQSAVGSYAPSSSSSSRSSRSSTRNHSPPPLRSATDKADNLMLQIKHFLDNDSYGSNDLVLSASPVEFAAFQRELHTPCFLHPHQVPDIRLVVRSLISKSFTDEALDTPGTAKLTPSRSPVCRVRYMMRLSPSSSSSKKKYRSTALE